MKNSDAAITTQTLMKRLIQTVDFEQFKTQYYDAFNVLTLSEYLKRLCEERGIAHEQIIKRACLDRTYGHQIFCGLRQPTRDKVIQLAFGFGMSLEETQALLKIAHHSALYPRIERDAAISFCLHKKMSFLQTQLLLDELHLSQIGKEQNREPVK